MPHKSIALVDLSALFKRHFMSNPKAPGESAHNTIAELSRLRDQIEHIVLCLDAPPYSRKKLYPEYKATREAPDPSEIYQKRWLYEEVQRAGFQIARHPGAEGDDVIATLARVYGESCPQVLLVGADKDLAQCVTANVLQYIPATFDKPAMTRDPEGVATKFGVTPELMPLFLALQGDKSDNVPGVPGIGKINAAKLANKFRTRDALAAALPSGDPIVGPSLWKALAEHWHQFVLSLELVTLDAYLPLDHVALLERLEPQVPEEMSHQAVELDGFMGNATPAPARPEPRIGRDPQADEILARHAAEREVRANAVAAANVTPQGPKATHEEITQMRERIDAGNAAERAGERPQTTTPSPMQAEIDELARKARARVAAGLVDETGREVKPEPANQVRSATEAEFDPIGPSPGASGPLPPKPERPSNVAPVQPSARTATEQRAALAKATPDYGLVTEDLQPQDLRSAEVISKWLAASNLYPKFGSPAAIFAIMLRAKEMKLGMATALAGFHVIEGKVVASAQLLLALAKRSPKCKYFRKVHSDAESAEWETWHADDPEPTRYKYTAEEAREAGLVSGNWKTRRRDMLSKTAYSKLAREVYPEETLGLYAEEEFDDVRRAA